MIYAARGRYGSSEPNPTRCAEAVSSGFGFHQCLRKGVLTEMVDGKEYVFCKQHAPSTKLAKKKRRQSRWEAEEAIDRAEDRIQRIKERLATMVVAEDRWADPRLQAFRAKIMKAREQLAKAMKAAADHGLRDAARTGDDEV